MRKCRCLLLMMCMLGSITAPSPAAGQCKVTATTMDGVKQITIENNYVRLTFIPSRGGLCTSFLYKPTGVDWTTPKRGGGLFEDHLWNTASYKKANWGSVAYDPKILGRTPEKAELELTGKGTGKYQFHIFKKTVSLRRGSAAVRVRYEHQVHHDAMSPQVAGLWFHHGIAVPNQRMTYYHPVQEGVKELAFDPSMPSDERWEYGPTRGWIGAVSEKGSGFACKMEYKRLMCLYQWFGANLATVEWMFRNETIPNDGSVVTDIVLHPFHGLLSVSGVGAGGVASVTIPARVSPGASIPLVGTVALTESVRGGTLAWSWRRLPDLLWREHKAETISTARPERLSRRTSFTPKREGVYLIQLKVLNGNRVLVEGEAPVSVGHTKEKYALAPAERRIGDPEDRFGKIAYKAKDVELPLTRKVVSPHVPWGRPYYKARPKVLFLMPFHNSREIVELAQRMELDYDAPLISYSTGNVYVGDAYGKMNGDIVRDLLKKYLAKDGYDVIVVCAVNLDRLDKALAGLVKKQVEKGVGLVYVTPWFRKLGGRALASVVGIREDVRPGQLRSGAAWRRAGDSFIVDGVPAEALPPTGLLSYSRKDLSENAHVFLEATRGTRTYPVGFTLENGRQRTVVFNYRASRIVAGHADCLTPFLRYPRERFHYWEYHLSMIAKAILWAAKKESAASIQHTVRPSSPEFGRTPILVEVRVSGKESAGLGPSRLECTVRDKYWRTVVSKTFPLLPSKGRATASLSITEQLPVGTYFVDCILRSQGKSVTWGTHAFEVTGQTRIDSVRLADSSHVFKSGDTVSVAAQIANARSGLSLQCVLADSLGREIRRQRVSVGADGRATAAFPVESPLATVGYVRVALQEGTQTIDTADVDFVTLPDSYASRQWDDYHVIPWGSLGGYRQGYLIPTISRMLKEGGVTALYPNSNWTGEEDLRIEHESSLRAGFRLVENGMWSRSYPKGYEEDRRNYQKTGDKKYLERKPSLSDPAYRRQVTERVREKVHLLKRYAPLCWIYGDEQSVIGRIPVFDYDWSPHALKDFRTWLAKEYGSLQALNREWRTNYRDWDEVTPLTGSEARRQKNYAPWSDHRTFMERSYAGFFKLLSDTINEVLPNSRTGLSGTQSPSAYNGIDWARFMRVFTCMQPYYNQGQGEMMPSFNPDCRRARWGGYGGGGMNWGDFLRGDVGCSYYSMASFLNPDFSYSRSAERFRKHSEPVRKGLGKLWTGVRPEYDKIGILYSQRSLHGAYVLDKKWWYHHQAWFEALYSLLYSPRFVPYQELDAGRVMPAQYKVFILPMTVAVSDRQAASLERYVRAGGVVIADFLAGAMDGHCQVATPGTLDSLFGIRRTGFRVGGPQGKVTFAALRSSSLRSTSRRHPSAGIDLSPLATTTSLPEGGITLAGGTALGALESVPYAVVNRAGAGRTCYLNIDMSKYRGLRGQPAGEFYRALVARLMVWGGLTPMVTTDSREFTTRIFRHREGANLYVGHYRPGNPDTWTLRFACGRRHIYHMLTGRYHGYASQVERGESDFPIDLYALLPYRVTGLSVRLRRREARPGERVVARISLATDGGSAGRHVVRVAVTRPDGKDSEVYSGNLDMPGGERTFDLPFALNDPPGVWRIAARDVVTGTSATATVRLLPR